MILDINKDSRIAEFKIDALIQLAENAFNKFNESIKEELDKLNDQRVFSAKYVYPSNCNTINKNTIYVSTPMASFTANQYEEFKKDFL